MTISRDQVATLRSGLGHSLQQAVAIDPTHAAMLRQQIAHDSTARENGMLPALVCKSIAASLGAPAEVASAMASSLALMIEMAHTFAEITDGSNPARLIESWGLPRTLNAGDGFYATAQNLAITGSESLTADRRLKVVQALDAGCRAFAVALYEAQSSGAGLSQAAPALLPCAAVLAGLAAGLDDADLSKLAEYGESLTSARMDESEDAGLQRIVSGAMTALGRS